MSSCPGRSAKRVFALDVPGIHVLNVVQQKDVDGRDKPGHDEVKAVASRSSALASLR